MTKVELVKEIAKQTGVDQATALVVVEGMMQTIKDSLVRKENIYLRGFGTFALKRRAEKTARNISKNTSIIVPAHDIPSFKPCRDFMDEVASVALQPSTSAQE
ncbi:MAG: integration host factor subunit beta [Prevotellaceae bacterium]|nr:integration host factor subunit beta [Prevotellaceae bacterium]